MSRTAALRRIACAVILASCVDAPTAADRQVPLTPAMSSSVNTAKITHLRLYNCAVPAWAAYKNAGQPWRQITIASDGAMAFDATARFALALVMASDGSAQTELYFMT